MGKDYLALIHDPTADTHLSGVERMIAVRSSTALLSRQGMLETVNATQIELGGDTTPYDTAREAIRGLVGSDRIDGTKAARIVDQLLADISTAGDHRRSVTDRINELAGDHERGMTKEAMTDLALDVANQTGNVTKLQPILAAINRHPEAYFHPRDVRTLVKAMAQTIAVATV